MKKTVKFPFKIESGSHPGMTGKKNEDRCLTTTYLAGEKQIPCVLSVLCDGIGGHHAGEVAAEMGVSIITESITAGDPDNPLKTIQSAVTKASHAIYQASLSDEQKSRMGATCAIAWLIGDRLNTANLGDSRIYLLRQGHLVQLTTDHTWVQEALDAGLITADLTDEHPNAHVIRRYLGSKIAPVPDFRLWVFEGEEDADAIQNQGMEIRQGDILLLCSDGLTDLVTDQEILEIVQANPLTEVPDILIQLANKRGGYDNTTVVLIESPPKRGFIPRVPKKKGWVAGCFGGLILLVTLLTAVILGISYFDGRFSEQATPTPILTQTLPVDLQTPHMVNTSTTSPTPTSTGFKTPNLATPQYTITPWPTHTKAP
jgi:protein phosphatase